MLTPLIAFVAGLVVLVWSAHQFVIGASTAAKHLLVSTLLIGMVIVGFGTSMPEMVVSVMASFNGNSSLASGNALGSNIFNILAVAGVAGMVQPAHAILPIVLTRDWATMSVMTLVLLVMGYGLKRPGRINRIEGGLLLVGYLGYTVFVLSTA